ncbi:MAG: hypothetical protein KUG77_01250 [Nannocystaceae bacterium]|nr:hypothetical protein [Nannocystaceae bacterium]
MGRASRDDRAQGLSNLAQRLPAAIAAAQTQFEQEVIVLARAPRGFAAGFASARARLLAPLDAAEHEASVRGTQTLSSAVRKGRKLVDGLLAECLGDAALLRTLERAAPSGRQWQQLRLDFEDAGARLSVSQRRELHALSHSLQQQTQAFCDHAVRGPSAGLVRARLRAQTDPRQREQTWAAFHNHASAAAHLPLEILRLRRDWARLLGFSHYASWVERDVASPETTMGWLDAMAEAARARAQMQPPTEPWNRHAANGDVERVTLPRDLVVERLRATAQALVPSVTIGFDVEPRLGKRGGAWTHVPATPGAPVTVCASLAVDIDLEGLRTLLHEVGHAAEALVSPTGLRIAPNALEFSSTILEPFAWHAPTLEQLTGRVVEQRALSQARRARFGRPTLGHLALARADRALHADFNPDTDGSPLPWARRVYERVEGMPRDPRDATVATHMHLFARPHGYAARYATYPLGDALAEHHWAHGAQNLPSTLSALASTLWTAEGRGDPIGMLSRVAGAPASPAAFIRATLA